MKNNNTEVNTIVITENEMKVARIQERLNDLNAIKTTGRGAEISALKSEIEALCKETNEAALQEVTASFFELYKADRVAAMDSLVNKTVTFVALALEEPKKDTNYAIKETEKRVPFTTLEKAWKLMHGEAGKNGKIKPSVSATLARQSNYQLMLAYFVDNLSRNIAGDLSDGVERKVSAPAANVGEADKKKADFSGCSVNSLEKQLNTLVGALLPEGMEITMKKADVRAILAAAKREKEMAFTVLREDRILDKVFLAMEVRMNNHAYNLDSKAKVHKPVAEKPHKAENAKDKKSKKAA